jgi:PII-like signaling protein
MTPRVLDGSRSLLRIYFDEFDRVEHEYAYEWVLDQAKKEGLAGCTVLRGRAGYGRGKIIRTEFWFEGAGDFSVVVEIVDNEDRIEKFWKQVQPRLHGSLITQEQVFVHHYSHTKVDSAAVVSSDITKEIEMSPRNLSGAHTLLRIYFGESDRADGEPLHFVILKKARDRGLAGCTVLRGITGFGASTIVHEDHLFRLSSDLPMVVEIVDTSERTQAFLSKIEPFLEGALVTEEEVHVHHYSHGRQPGEQSSNTEAK